MTSSTTLAGDMFVGAARTTGTRPVVRARNPRDGSPLEPAYGTATPADIDRAAELATAAARPFRETTGEQRAALLETIAARLEDLGDPIVARGTAETGILESRLRGELARTTGQLRMFAGLVRGGGHLGVAVDPAQPGRRPLPRPDLRRRDIALGPVAVFGASNFPLAFSVAGGDTASALAAGCPVLIKAHPSHPGTSELVAGAVAGAAAAHGLPEGVFSMLQGGADLGRRLAGHPAIKAVAFTGSRAAGLALTAAAAARPVPIPVYAEMSSVNPVFLLPGALADRGAEIGRSYVRSLTVGTGQLCTNPGLVFAVGDDAAGFLDAAAATVRAEAATPMLSEHIRRAYEKGTRALGTHPGVTLLASGRPGADIAEGGVAQVFVTTADAWQGDPALSEEVFGPASLIVRVPSAGLLPALIDRLEGQLTATVHLGPGDDETARSLLPHLEDKAGRIIANGWPTGVEVGTATVHGGPYPATSDGRTTSVGTMAVQRFLRPVAYQDFPATLLPPALR